ncbi:MAG: DNA topoisomerase IB [Bryobacteraceae bacterium]|nr:DNA topoisomerase IB [Bryobacteraceae bacterium]
MTSGAIELPLDPQVSAELVGLRYVSSGEPGITRRRSGRGWLYRKPDGTPVREPAELERIRSLVIPPAWKSVWICARANGHLQAVGIDARGRRQYRYHARYREVRDSTKFNRMAAFGRVLPKIRAQVEQDLKLGGLPRRKVVATVVRLLEATSVRIGNEEYAKSNESFGLTTLRDHHVEIEGHRLRFSFRGKSGQPHEVEITDRQLGRIVAACQDLPGQELFQFVEEGQVCRICSEDVNAYLKEVTGEDFTAKDFRTWNGSREALAAFARLEAPANPTQRKRSIAAVVRCTAEVLRNRPATCRAYYIHPAVFAAFEAGTIQEFANFPAGSSGLSGVEAGLMQLIDRHVPALPLKPRRGQRPRVPAPQRKAS